MNDLAASIAHAFAHPVTIVLVIIVSLVWARSRWKNDTLTMWLSILSISAAQLILLDGQRTDVATQAKLDALVARTAPALVRAEEKPIEQIERMRR